MQKTRIVKQKLNENKLTVGTWLTLAHLAHADMAAQLNFDWIVIDLEHSTISLSEAENLIRVVDGHKKTALVRVSSNNPVQIKRVMDSGAHGIIVPMIKTKHDIIDAYQAMHYPPLGFRGAGLARAQAYGPGFNSYLKWSSESSILIGQIEHVDALEHLGEIFATPEMDGFIIGPYDLSASMGIAGQFDHPNFLEALKQILAAGKQFNKPAGIHIVEPNPKELEQRIEEGYRFIAYSLDMRILQAGFKLGAEAWSSDR